MAVNYERKKVKREVATLDIDYSTVAEAIRELQSVRKCHGNDARIERSRYEYSDGEYWAITAMFDETDEEMRKRIAEEEKWEADQAVRDRRDFERLKAKFGG
jgi:hypothetical protein